MDFKLKIAQGNAFVYFFSHLKRTDMMPGAHWIYNKMYFNRDSLKQLNYQPLSLSLENQIECEDDSHHKLASFLYKQVSCGLVQPGPFI